MKIRPIERSDYDEVCELLKLFAEESTITSFKQQEYDHEYAKKLLEFSCAVGICICAEDQGKIQGILLSIRDRDIWIPKIIRLKELAWYVRPEARNSTVAARLFHSWFEQAEKLRQQGEIASFNFTKLKSSPEFNLARRGFKEVETHYMFGE